VKKKNNTYQFLNIINEKKFSSYSRNEKEKFLIDNKIYIPNDLKDPHWSYKVEYSDESDELMFIAELNVLVTKEILRYCKNYTGFMPWYDSYEKSMKRIINMTLDDIDKERIIREQHEKYMSILNANYLTEDYFDNKIEENDMFGCVTIHGIDETTVVKFITNKHPYLGSDSPFSDCNEIMQSIKILNFLKEEMNKIKSPKGKINQNQTTLTFDKNIFRSKESQKWFHETLIEFGAIDEENKAQRGIFQTRCQAIFSISECKNKIFKNRLKLKDYIDYLNAAYSAKIKNNSRLSDGYKYIEDVKGYLNLFINK